jgi:hypothetical protein
MIDDPSNVHAGTLMVVTNVPPSAETRGVTEPNAANSRAIPPKGMLPLLIIPDTVKDFPG